MYSLRLACKPEELDAVSAELWEAGTIGIHQIDEKNQLFLIAGFETNEHRSEILRRFSSHTPEWRAEDVIDWAAVSRDAWPEREVGARFFLTPAWSEVPTPAGRLRLVHNPGLACGTGEHPCTRLALIALEKYISPRCSVVDVGAGSGILTIAALRLGAGRAVGIDIDCSALAFARENFALNGLTAELICGSADVLAAGCSELTIANISGTVLLSIWEDLLRITHRPGCLVLTGFSDAESRTFKELSSPRETFELEGWSCLVIPI